METLTHDSPYDDALETAIRAARRAATVIRDQSGSRTDVRAKTRNDFVTQTDEAAQAVAVETLREAHPDDQILAEEGEEPDAIPAVVDGRRRSVDPLDGTTNFMHQVPPYAVSIALQEDDALVAGVVLNVPHEELFTAVAGHGLLLNGQPVEISPTEDFEDAFLATGFPYRRFEHTERYLDVLADILRDARGVRRHGSAAIDCARTACGRFDGFYETGLKPWDVAAGVLLIREGGGRVTTYDGRGGLAPVYDRQICASNDQDAIHEGLLDGLRPMQDIRL